MSRFVTAALMPLLFVSPAAQDRPNAATIEAKGDKIVIEPGVLTLKDVVARSCEILKRNELMNWLDNPQHEQERIILPLRIEVDRAGFDDVVRELMYVKRYVLTPIDPGKGMYRWIFMPGPARAEIQEHVVDVPIDEIRKGTGPRQLVRTVYVPRHVSVQQLADVVRAYLSMYRVLGFEPVAVAGTGLVLTMFRRHASETVRLLDQIDAANALPANAGDRMRALEARIEGLEKLLGDGGRK